jgi:hypothetical protein
MTSVFHFHHEHSEPPKLANAHALLRKAHHEFKHLPKVPSSDARSREAAAVTERPAVDWCRTE